MMTRPSPVTKPTSISSLPNDLLLNCSARVSRLYHPILSLVSKRFRSLFASPELYKARSHLHHTESCLYVSLNFPCEPRWFTLCMRPNRSLNNNDATGYLLVPISSPPPSVKANTSNVVAVGSEIYEIGGIIDYVSSSTVWVLDCMSHTWREGPRMNVARIRASANVVDGKIYVFGGWKSGDFSGWIEVFDPKTQTWKQPVSTPGTEIHIGEEVHTPVIDGKLYFYVYGHESVVYNRKNGTFEESNMCEGLYWYSSCVINNVLFYYEGKVFKWYDTKVRDWKILKGLEGLPTFPSNIDIVKMADYGGKMVIFWEEDVLGTTRIWCAEISLERCNNEDEISGTVVWFDVVFEVPIRCGIVSVFAATV